VSYDDPEDTMHVLQNAVAELFGGILLNVSLHNMDARPTLTLDIALPRTGLSLAQFKENYARLAPKIEKMTMPNLGRRIMPLSPVSSTEANDDDDSQK
jgi:hypothetical protein